jgi:hypothetical protein
MRFPRIGLKILVIATLTLFFLVVVAEVMARRGGGRGGGRGQSMGRTSYTRVGPASGGSFVSRPTTRYNRPPVSRPAVNNRPATARPRPRPLPVVPPEERQEKREEIREKRQERREEIRDKYWDDWHHGVAIGTVYTTSDFDAGYCEASVIVEGVTYYQCDGVWYKRAYAGGTVTYVVVDGPRNN